MGCECSKPRYFRLPPKVELHVSECEDWLGYSKHNSVVIWGELRATASPALDRKQFLNYLTNLSLNKEGFDSPAKPLHRFYSFYRQNNEYEKRKLAILGLLMGHGTVQSKVDVLYQLYDAEELKHSELERAFRELLIIASIELPSYAQYWMELMNEPDQAEKLAKYREKLAIAIPDTVQLFLRQVTSGSEASISRSACISRLTGELSHAIFVARNLRMLSLNVYKQGRTERERRRNLNDRDIAF